ncbi:hypothetical protein ACP4OV_025816 [Aristida adscensionis]
MSNKRGSDCSSSSDRQEKDLKSSEKYDTDVWNLRRPLPPTSTFEEEFGSSSDSCQGAWSEFSEEVVSNLSKSVISVASLNGDEFNCTCTGIVIRHHRSGMTILTSADLFRSPHDPNKTSSTLRLHVYLPNMKGAIGVLQHHDLDYNIAVVYTHDFPGIQEIFLGNHLQYGPHSKVVAVGRGFYSGKLMASTGTVTDEPAEKYMISTCKITRSGIGGPLIDSDGNFVGMNFCNSGKNTFLPRNKIRECLQEFWDSVERDRIQIRKPPSWKEPKYIEYVVSDITKLPHFRPLPDDEFTASLTKKLNSNGYPLPITLEGRMHLLYGFEEEFAANIEEDDLPLSVYCASRSVVSLASFHGETRVFACTVWFRNSVDANEIDDKLEIQVQLPNNECTKGILQHYNLNYNIAVVSIVGFHGYQKWKAIHNFRMQVKPYREVVVAIGCVFRTGKLMTTGGTVTRRKGKLDCKELMISTCKITMAGIGGPLIDFTGNFIGMNFYDKEQTPYLPVDKILMLLREFDAKGDCCR